MICIAVHFPKGGSAKSTTVWALAHFLSVNFHVLVIDMDSQATVTNALVSEMPAVTAYELLKKKASLEDATVSVTGKLRLIAGSAQLASLEAETAGEIDRPYMLQDSLHKIADVVLVDTPPFVGMLTVASLVCATHAKISDLERSIANFVRFIASGTSSETISNSLTEAEDRLKHLKNERTHLLSQAGSQIFITPGAIRDRMARLDDVLGKKVVEANRILKLIFPNDIKLTPTTIGRKAVYEATGTINLFSMLNFKVDAISEKFSSSIQTEPTKFTLNLSRTQETDSHY